MGKSGLNNKLISDQFPISQLVLKQGIKNMTSLLHFVSTLPYGRNSNRADVSLVMKEGKGTCSSKHAFVKKVADENNWEDVELILGMFKMNQINTPKIGDTLTSNGLEFIPEAHCYIRFEEERIDITLPTSSFENIANDILFEQTIASHQVNQFKVEVHQNYLKEWIAENKMDLSFEEIWNIREKCIARLSE